MPQHPASHRPRPHADTDILLDQPERCAIRTLLGHHPAEMVYSPYVSPASEWVLSVFHGSPVAPGPETPKTNPYIRVPPGHGLFTDFPRTLIIAGDSERFTIETAALGQGMARDGVRVRNEWLPDAVHDVLIMLTWDERVRNRAYHAIAQWVREGASAE